MYTKALFSVGVLAVAELASGASARAILASDLANGSFVVAADDTSSSVKEPRGTKPIGQAPSENKDAAPGSAKMGTDEGSHTSDGQGTSPESDTNKVEQPTRRNVPQQ
jgi:hypothetical protein